jgi:hypothetical protein
MPESLAGLNVIAQALVATIVTYLLTAVSGTPDVATLGLIGRFTAMMVLDNALG